MTKELQFNHQLYSMKEVPLIKNMIVSKISSQNKKEPDIIWMKLEAQANESLEDICQYDLGQIINLKLKNITIKACFIKQKDIAFKTQIYKKITLENVHRFLFPVGVTKKEIDYFFSHLIYKPGP